jgi:YVTN family beta-propeller protein
MIRFGRSLLACSQIVVLHFGETMKLSKLSIVVVAMSAIMFPSIGTQADSVTTTIGVGSRPAGVAINRAGTLAYVTNELANTVSKINLATDQVVATITVGTKPRGVAINPAGTFAYVANQNSNSVSKINVATDQVVATITVASPRGVAINPLGTFAYVSSMAANTVSKINLATDQVDATITVATPRAIAINPVGTFAYVATISSVLKINLATDQVDATITVASVANPFDDVGLAINPAGTYAYVTNWFATTVSKINLATDQVDATIIVLPFPVAVAINPAGTFAYVMYSLNNSGVPISKINLATDQVIASTTVGNSPVAVAINPAGTFAYVANQYSDTVSKIALSASEPQSISFTAISSQLLSTKTVALSATALAPFAVTFSSVTPTVCTVSGSTVTLVTIGDCTINANQAGGSGWDAAPQVSKTFTILPSPPAGEAGVSIKNGDSYSNSKQVGLNLVWPAYATAVRISNDGGFAASKTQTKDLAASIDWELDDSVKGIYTKVVYVRFNGVADTTKTYSDDIILDTNAPIIETSSAALAASSVDLSLKVTDDITGVNKVEIRYDTKTVTKDYATKVSVPLADLSLSVSSSGVRKLAAASVELRVSDNAGNWTGWQTVALTGLNNTPVVTTPTVTIPTVTTKKAASAKSIAVYAKLKVLSTSKVSLKVVSRYVKYCKVSGASLRGVKAGTCKVTVTVTPKKGKVTSKTVTLKVTK